MTVQLGQGGDVELRGVCSSAEAEILLGLLLQHPGAAVDWRLCDGAHTAVVQVLAAAGRTLHGPPRDLFLRDMVEPALHRR